MSRTAGPGILEETRVYLTANPKQGWPSSCQHCGHQLNRRFRAGNRGLAGNCAEIMVTATLEGRRCHRVTGYLSPLSPPLDSSGR